MDPTTVQNIYDAYSRGLMSPEQEAEYESDVRSGKMQIPGGMSLKEAVQKSETPAKLLDAGVIDAYRTGQMTPYQMAELERDIEQGVWQLPEGMELLPEWKGEMESLGFFGRIKEQVTGAIRSTEETKNLKDIGYIPELNKMSMASFKTAAGHLVSTPSEFVKILKKQYPETEIRQDEKGNYIVKSSLDGNEYAIKPGFRVSDLPKVAATTLAFTPAGKATTTTGQVLGAMGTQVAIETGQAAIGGEFDVGEVVTAGAGAGAGHQLGKVFSKVSKKVRGVITEPIEDAIEEGTELTTEDLMMLTKRAAKGSKKAQRLLAAQADVNEEVLQAADNLGIIEYLQPDHLTTNKAYREIAQGIRGYSGSRSAQAELEAIEQLSKKADGFIEELGGTTDLGRLDRGLKEELQTTHDQLYKKAEDLYGEVDNIIKSQAPSKQTISSGEQRSVDLYFGEEGPDILREARGYDVSGIYTETIKDVESALQKSSISKDRTVWRGIADPEGRFSNLNPGDNVSESTFISTSNSKGVARDYISELSEQDVPTILEISVPKGQKGIEHLTDFEQEVLLPSSKFKVKEVINNPEGVPEAGKLVKLEIIPDLIETSPIVKTTNIRNFLESKAEDLGGVKFLSPIERKILNQMRGKVPYARLDQLRRDITAARVRKEGVFKDADSGLLKKLEKELYADQRAAANEFGALDQFNLAQSTAAAYKGIQDDMKSIFGRNLDGTLIDKLSTGMKKVSTGDINKLEKLLNIESLTPEMRKEMMASGLVTAFRKKAASGEMDLAQFVDWYDALQRSGPGFNFVMTNLPKEGREGLRNFYIVAKGIRDSAQINKGRIRDVGRGIENASNLITNVYKKVQAYAPGIVVISKLGLKGMGLAHGITSAVMQNKPNVLKAADELISSPEFIKMAGTGSRESAAKVIKTSAWKRFFKAIGEPRELSDPEQWLLKSWQSTRQLTEE